MEEIISLIVANGLWAVLFCGLLVYQLRDSRSRESKYTQTIRALSERLNIVTSVKADTTDIKADTEAVKSDVKVIRSDADVIKSTVLGGKKSDAAGAKKCAKTTA